MADVITESGMDFIADNICHIEKSRLYTSLGDGVRSVEFIRIKDDKMLFVEAKSIFPNPNNLNEGNLARYKSEIDEICEKFVHSLNLYSSVRIGVTDGSFTNGLVSPMKVSLVFILVVSKHKPEWCTDIQKTIRETLPSYLKMIWKPEVYVMNHETATKKQLTVVSQTAVRYIRKR